MNGADEQSAPPASGARLLVFGSGLALALFSAAVLFLFDPATTRFRLPCPSHAITGLHCPGCGSLRAAHQLLHGRLAAAFGYNPLAVLALPFLAYGFIWYGVSAAKKRPLPGASVRAFWIWLLLAVVIAFWVLRNIPLYPFTLLAP